MSIVNVIPPAGECEWYVKRAKRNCDNPATWHAKYHPQASSGGSVQSVTMACCQLHAKRLYKEKRAVITRILPVGDMTFTPSAELPHCPSCGAATQVPVLENGKPICPFCGEKQ
jgi:hypothetical protein